MVVFRGTEPLSLVDWSTDFMVGMEATAGLGRMHSYVWLCVAVWLCVLWLCVLCVAVCGRAAVWPCVLWLCVAVGLCVAVCGRVCVAVWLYAHVSINSHGFPVVVGFRGTSGFKHALGIAQSQLVNQRPDPASLYCVLCRIVDSLSAGRGRGTIVYVTGHSLGAALAATFAAHYMRDHPNVCVRTYPFAQPRVGDGDFCTCLDALVAAPMTPRRPRRVFRRFVNNNDVIPRSAATMMGYCHEPPVPADRSADGCEAFYIDAYNRLHRLPRGYWSEAPPFETWTVCFTVPCACAFACMSGCMTHNLGCSLFTAGVHQAVAAAAVRAVTAASAMATVAPLLVRLVPQRSHARRLRGRTGMEHRCQAVADVIKQCRVTSVVKSLRHHAQRS